MNKHFEELAERCGTYIAPHNNEVTWKEIDFLCEHVVRECADWVMANVVNGQEMRDHLLSRFNLSGYDDDLVEDEVEADPMFTVDEVLDAMCNRMGWAIGQSATRDIKRYLELKDDPDYQTFLKLKAIYDR